MREHPLAILIVILIQLIHSHASAVDLIVNGSFEDPNINDFWGTRQAAAGDLLSGPAGYWAQLQAGNGELTGWAVTQGNIDIVRNEWPAFDGFQTIDLVGFDLGGLQQTFSTTPGSLYHLSFEYGNNPSNGGGTAQIDLIGQSSIFSDTIAHYNSGNPSLNWVNYTTDFVADSYTTILRFTALTKTNSGGILLDDVSVVQSVPEPSSVILTSSGLMVLACVRRRCSRLNRNACTQMQTIL